MGHLHDGVILLLLPESFKVFLPCANLGFCYLNLAGIDLVTVFDAILASRQTLEKLPCFHENLMSNNFRRTAVLKNI